MIVLEGYGIYGVEYNYIYLDTKLFIRNYVRIGET